LQMFAFTPVRQKPTPSTDIGLWLLAGATPRRMATQETGWPFVGVPATDTRTMCPQVKPCFTPSGRREGHIQREIEPQCLRLVAVSRAILRGHRRPASRLCNRSLRKCPSPMATISPRRERNRRPWPRSPRSRCYIPMSSAQPKPPILRRRRQHGPSSLHYEMPRYALTRAHTDWYRKVADAAWGGI
jgi:hypothetical protein